MAAIRRMIPVAELKGEAMITTYWVICLEAAVGPFADGAKVAFRSRHVPPSQA